MKIVVPEIMFSKPALYRVSKNSEIELAGYYAAKVSVSGPEVTPFGLTPGSNITASLSEAQVTIGWTYHFGAEAPAPVRAKF